MTTAEEKRAIADKIANDHGCDLGPSPNGGVAITVQAYWSQGDPADVVRIRECRAAMRSAGVAPWEGPPLGTVKVPRKVGMPRNIEIAPALRIGKTVRS